MAEITFNKESVRRVPINRNSLFYDSESYQLEMQIGKDYIEQDMGQSVVLYQVDASITNADSVYGETRPSEVKYKVPVEVPCVYKLDEPELKSYDKEKNLGTYVKMGKLTVSVYQETLDELGVTISKGDYLGVQVSPTKMLYYVVNFINNGYDNKHSMWGTVPLWKTIEANVVDASEFNG